MNKPRAAVICGALLAIVLLACAVCALHWMNAVSLRGSIPVGGCIKADSTEEGLVPLVEKLQLERGILEISGALLRMDQPVGKVHVRVGLIAQEKPDEMILLNTQMVRRFDMAQTYGCDDHCGFHATVKKDQLTERDGAYRVVLVDEQNGTLKMIETGYVIMADGSVAERPEEVQNAH